ncbi:MAG: SMC-Scp complex subunit ScpB, partial [Candidatus Coatesbacteria bacterium]
MESKKAIIEALLFLSSRPLKDEEIKAIVGRDVNIDILIEQLEEEYRSSGRAFTIRRVANGYQMFTRPEYSPYIDMLFKERRRRSLSRAALETLAIIAYKQPTTKSEIEWVRGVDSSG